MTLSWSPSGLMQQPLLHIQDPLLGSFEATNTEGLTLEQASADYGTQSSNQETRNVQIREVTTQGAGQWTQFSIPYVAPPPLVNLEWQGGGPTWTTVQWVHLQDNGANFAAPNPEGWTIEECAEDYGNAPVPGYEPRTPVCENREPHMVTARFVGSMQANGEWSEHDITPTFDEE